MNIKKLTLNSASYPAPLRKIHSSPDPLYYIGADLKQLLKRPSVAIVGTRRVTPYGERVTRELASQLAEQGVVIISGLAFGVDALAHRAALEVGGLCIAVLPSPLDNIVPISNRRLARRILDKGGALVSEYQPGLPPQRQNFIARNRLVSGLADAVLVTEAGAKSGARYTAGFGFDQGKPVLAVPGNIYHQGSVGIHNLFKADKAAVATSSTDVLHALKLTPHHTKAQAVRGRNAPEQTLLDLMLQGITDGVQLLERSGLNISLYNQTLTMLEISNKIRPLGANHWSIY